MKKKSVKKKKKEEFSLKQEYKKSWEYLRKSKNYLWAITIIFLTMAIIGFLVPAPEFISEKIMQLIEEIINKTQGMSSLELVAFIIGNNVQTSFIGMVLGFIFGIFPIITTVINGYLLGFVGFISVNSSGWVSLLKLLPHGIFELPAVIIALGLGLKLGTFPFKKNPRKSLREFLENSTRVFLLIVLPLLLIAGIIEGVLIFLIN
jgi:stage II sporulation protein M